MAIDKRDMRPLLLKLGVALALSFAGFLYSRVRPKRIRPNRPPSSPSSSGDGSKVDSRSIGRTGIKDGLRELQTTLSANDIDSVADRKHDEAPQQKVTVDDSTVGLSPSWKHSGDEEGFLFPEINELMLKEFDFTTNSTGNSPKKDVETTSTSRRAAEAETETEQELTTLRNMVRNLGERERNLEIQLLEYYGLREQETAVTELQNHLKIKNMETKILALKIESLQADNQRLEAQVADYAEVKAELESAGAKIKTLKGKIRNNAERTREQLYSLQQKVSNLQDQEHKDDAMGDPDIQKQLHRLKDLEDESKELRRDNLRLQLENSELARRLESNQTLASSVLKDPEAGELLKSNHRLKQENEYLSKEIERIQADCCTDVEELVYLRWLNACLRYELRNCQSLSGKTVARDLSRSLSPKSEERAKQLIIEYANKEGVGDKCISFRDFDSDYCSSQASNPIDLDDLDNSSVDYSSASKTNSSSKRKFLVKLKRLLQGKDNHNTTQVSSADRASTSPSAARESVHIAPPEDMVGRYSCDSLTSYHNSRKSETHQTAIEARIDRQRNKVPAVSQRLSRSSLDIQRLRNLSLEDIRDVNSGWRNSDLGSSYRYKGIVSGEDGVVDLSRDNQVNRDMDALQKLKLMKYAEVLKGSRGTPNSHRKSASYSC